MSNLRDMRRIVETHRHQWVTYTLSYVTPLRWKQSSPLNDCLSLILSQARCPGLIVFSPHVAEGNLRPSDKVLRHYRRATLTRRPHPRGRLTGLCRERSAVEQSRRSSLSR